MNTDTEQSRSPWMSELGGPASRLARDLKAEVVVVGAGIAGMTTAYLLARAGKDVVVLDPGPPGGGMVARTTGHLTCALDDRWFNIIASRGVKKARIAADSHCRAIDFIEETQARESIACDFARVGGVLVLGDGDNQKVLAREEKAAAQVNLAGVALSHAQPFPGVAMGKSLLFPNQARFHATKYINGLLACFRRDGGRIFAARVEDVKGGKKAVVTAGSRKVEAASVVVATNSPIDSMLIHAKQTPYRTYVVAGYVPKGAVPDVLAWDTAQPYHYTRLQPDGRRDLVIIGGEDHKTGTADDMSQRLARLESWARVRFPALEAFAFRWSGQVLETFDGLGLVGKNPGDDDNVFVISGDSGTGLTHGTIAGLTLLDTILGRRNAWAEVYRATRGKPKKVISHPDDSPPAKTPKQNQPASAAKEMPKGSGLVVGRGAQKIAVYRRPDGRRVACSAKCTHAGCAVAWNSFEKCWDCPCHGSHFAADGKVTNAPAFEDLKPVRRGTF